MKKLSARSRFVFYPLILLAILFGTSEYANITVFGSFATCCSYGEECPSGKGKNPSLRCCNPINWEADCSSTKRNYCRETCS